MSAAARILTMPPARQPGAILTTSAVAHMLSPSQVNTWLDCAARWYYHYALDLPEPRTAALAIGEAMHTVTAAALRIKARGQIAAWDHAEGLLRAHVAEALQSAELDEDEDPQQIADLAVSMLRVWFEQVFPAVQAEAVELRMEGSIGGVRVQGMADVITASGMIADLKTASKKPAGISSSHMLQLTTYAMLADQTDGKQHNAVRLYTITKTKTPVAIQQTVEVSNDDRRYAEWIYANAQQQMREGAITPRRSSNLCSKKHCAFWRHCIAEYGGQVRE